MSLPRRIDLEPENLSRGFDANVESKEKTAPTLVHNPNGGIDEPDGQETIYYRDRLVNASNTNLRQYTEMTAPGAKELAGAPPAGLDLRELEQVLLIFERIEIENRDANTSAADDWYR